MFFKINTFLKYTPTKLQLETQYQYHHSFGGKKISFTRHNNNKKAISSSNLGLKVIRTLLKSPGPQAYWLL
jgi:hypothetical protein